MSSSSSDHPIPELSARIVESHLPESSHYVVRDEDPIWVGQIELEAYLAQRASDDIGRDAFRIVIGFARKSPYAYGLLPQGTDATLLPRDAPEFNVELRSLLRYLDRSGYGRLMNRGFTPRHLAFIRSWFEYELDRHRGQTPSDSLSPKEP